MCVSSTVESSYSFCHCAGMNSTEIQKEKKKRDAYMNDWDEPKPWSWRLAVTNLLTGKRLELYNKGLDLQFDVITTYR